MWTCPAFSRTERLSGGTAFTVRPPVAAWLEVLTVNAVPPISTFCCPRRNADTSTSVPLRIRRLCDSTRCRMGALPAGGCHREAARVSSDLISSIMQPRCARAAFSWAVMVCWVPLVGKQLQRHCCPSAGFSQPYCFRGKACPLFRRKGRHHELKNLLCAGNDLGLVGSQ